MEFSLNFSKTSTATIGRGAPQSAHSYPHRKNKSNEIRKKTLFPTMPGPATFHALSLPALARAPKFPPVCKSATSGASDTPQNKKNQK